MIAVDAAAATADDDDDGGGTCEYLFFFESIDAPPFPVVVLAIVFFESDAFLTE